MSVSFSLMFNPSEKLGFYSFSFSYTKSLLAGTFLFFVGADGFSHLEWLFYFLGSKL
jgi:hypothetical protein